MSEEEELRGLVEEAVARALERQLPEMLARNRDSGSGSENGLGKWHRKQPLPQWDDELLTSTH